MPPQPPHSSATAGAVAEDKPGTLAEDKPGTVAFGSDSSVLPDIEYEVLGQGVTGLVWSCR